MKRKKVLSIVFMSFVLLLVSQTFLSAQSLSKQEIDGIRLMREEEKLARDVYLYLFDKWGIRIFSNIAKSEQTHMDAVKTIIDKYNLSDPVKNNQFGSFTSMELKKLYDELTKQGSKSQADAISVGLMIEELDISDLEKLLKETSNQDIITVYENLLKGSRNHLRSFNKQAKNYRINYQPKYITEKEFNAIINSSMERGAK